MNELLRASAPSPVPSTMSSREIAALTGKAHDNVLRDIRSMLIDLKKDVLSFEAMSPDSYGRPQRVFMLPKRETLILVSGYSVTTRAKIIDRWQELEDQAKNPIAALPPAELVQMLMAAERKVEVLASKAAVLDRIATEGEGSVPLRDAAGVLKVPERKFKQRLHQKGLIYPNAAGEWRAYAEQLKEGVFEHKAFSGLKPDGAEWRKIQVRVTAFGLKRLAERFPAGECA